MIEIFKYEGTPMTFENRNGRVMVNATDMAKPFGKKPAFFLNTAQTQLYINSLSELKKINSTDLVKVTHGDGGGTWMHEDVALEFARWLSPRFAIWCNDRIKELLKFGITATPQAIDQIIADPEFGIQLLTTLKEERAEKERLQHVTELQQKELKQAAPKVEYYNNVLQSVSTYTTTQIAKELGMSAVTLNDILKRKGVQYKQNGTWVLYSEHQDKEYTKTHTHTYETVDGIRTSMLTVWTEKGREFIHRIVKTGLKSA